MRRGRTVAAKAMALDVSCPVSPTRVVIMPNLQLLAKLVNSDTFSFRGMSSLDLAVYGSAGASPVEVLLKDMAQAGLIAKLVDLRVGLVV